MQSRKLLMLLALILVVAIGVFWWKSPSSKSIKKEATEKLTPNISIASVSISDIGDERIKMKSKVTLSNPLPVEISTKRLDYVVYIDSIKVIKESYEKPIRIKSSDSSTIELPMEILAKPLIRVLKYFSDKKIDSADYSMKATFEVDVPVAGERKFDMHLSKRLPAILMPKVKIKDTDLHALQLKKKGIDMVIQIINPNSFPIKIKDATFSFAIADDIKMDGVYEKIVNIPAHQSQDVSVHTEIAKANLLKGGWKIITDKKDTPFNLIFNCKIISDNGMLNDSPIAMKVHGTVDELLGAAKMAKDAVK